MGKGASRLQINYYLAAVDCSSRLSKKICLLGFLKMSRISEYFSLPVFLLLSRGLFTVFSVKFSKTINFQAFLLFICIQ